MVPKLWLDPRPDLAEDHRLWLALLECAVARADATGEPFWTLHGFRCLGARLTLSGRGTLVMHAGEMDAQDYQQARARYLTPMLATLKATFAEALSLVEAEAV
ncbi:MAG: hypothetical protein ACYC4R_17870 [Anaerolineae bacterium]